MRSLVIFYSRRGQNYVNGNISSLERGNAELIAEYIRDALGADVFEIDTVKSYSEDYNECIQEAKAEQREKARPELKAYLDDISEYDTVFIVAPNWWGVYPMAVYSQLERLDFTGTTVHFIVTHEGSGLGGVPGTIKKILQGRQNRREPCCSGRQCPALGNRGFELGKKSSF